MKRISWIFFLSSLLACHDDDSTPVVEPVLEMANLISGNYWVYEWYTISPEGEAIALHRKDSVYIEGDTLIAGRKYFIRKSNFFGGTQINKTLLFDSAQTLFEFPERTAEFSLDISAEFVRNIGSENEPLAIGHYAYKSSPQIVRVPAGEFTAINFQGRIESQDPDYPYGIRYHDNFYARNTGLVKMVTYFYSSADLLEMRLVRQGNVR